MVAMAEKRDVTQADYDANPWNQIEVLAKIAETVGLDDLHRLSDILKTRVEIEWLQGRPVKNQSAQTRDYLTKIAKAAGTLRELLADIDPRVADEITGVPGFGPDVIEKDYRVVERLEISATGAAELFGGDLRSRPREDLYKLAAVDLAYAYEEFTDKPYTWSGEYAGEEARYPLGRKFVESGLKVIWPGITLQPLATAGEHASRTLNKNR